MKLTERIRRSMKPRSFALSALFAIALGLAQTAGAADCYWAGGTSSAWDNTANWTTTAKKPINDGAYFRSDKFHNNFKSGSRAYLVTFSAAETNLWRTYFNNCGSASAPIILRGNNASCGLTGGDSTSNDAKNFEGIYIGTNKTGGNSGDTDSRASTGNAYVRFETGTYATCSTYSYFFLGNSSYDGHMTVAGATINPYSDFRIFSGSLTIESGIMNVTSWTRLENTARAKTINLNGGTLHTYRITKIGGTGAATVNFNGGTLRIKTDYNSVIDSGITVNVKANGGTIDVNGTTSTIPASFSEDSSSTGGGMKFIGGGTLTLGGSIGYTGGTTIAAGTTVKVDTAAKKDALLGSGVNTLKVIPPATAGEYALITITGSDEFSDSDLLKVALVPGSAGAATFSISNDRKSLMLSAPYIGGEISQSSPTLVFPGASLADLATHTLRARMQGGHVNDKGVEVTFFNRVETVENDVLTKVTYQLQALDGQYTKCVYVDFTEDASGVYAKLADGNYGTYGGSLNTFGTEPLTSNADSGRQYYPYDFRLVEPANAISVNFNHTDGNMLTTSSSRVGAGDYAVPYTSWNNMSVSQGSSATFGGATFTQTKTSGQYKCSDLNKSKDLRYGYLDDSGLTVVVDVTNIPYEFYRIVTYHATDNKNIKFGHVTINGVNYTGTTDATIKGNATWGATGEANKAKGLREGVNYLVSDVMSGSSVTITGHRDKSSSPTCRGCIAAIQIVEYVPTTYTATIGDGGAKSFSALSWDNALPSLLTANDRIVVNVNEDTTLDIDIAVDVYGITFNVADGKTLTLSGNNIAAQYITATGAGQTVVASASQLAGTVKGDGTLVYDSVRPTTTGTDIVLTDPLWTGTVVIKGYNKGNSATGNARALFPQFWGSANSKIKWNGVCGYFGGCTSAAGWILEDLEDGGTTYPALTKNDGGSSSLTTAPSLEGAGTFADASNPTERFKFVNADNFTGTINITSASGYGMDVQFGATAVAVVPGAIHVLSGATVTIADGLTWTATGGVVVNGTLNLGAGANAPKIAGGTGTVGVASGTGTVNGYGSSAAVTFSTASETTLAIVDNALTAMTIGDLNNNGTLDLTGTALTEATLKLGTGVTAPTTGTILYPATFQKFVVSPADQTMRSLADFTTLPTLPEGATYYVTVAETREEFGKGSMIVTNCAASVNVRVARPNGTSIDMTPADGTMTLTEAAQIAGAATAFDATYTNTVAYAYRAPGWNAGSGQDVKPPTYNNTDNDETTGMYILHHPWVSDVNPNIFALGDFTLVVVGKMSPSRSTQFLHIGSSSGSLTGLIITTTENEDEVLIAKNTGNVVDAANGVKASVPNAATARHAYVINKKGTVFEVWVDGVKRGQFDTGDGFTLGSTSSNGIQIGSDISGSIKNANIYKGVPNTPETETGVINVIRLFDYSITEAQAEAVFSTYPYVSQGGLYTRTVTADGTFSETDTWAKDGEAGTFGVPEGATVDEVYYNPSATLTVNAAAEIGVNASVSIETLTVGGTAPVTFKADGTHTLTVIGAAIVNSPVTNEYGAVYLAGAPVQLGSSGAICFDCSGMDVSKVYAVTRFQLTGLTDRNDEKFSLIPPTDPDRSYEIVYNTTGSCYDFVVTPLHNYIVANNMVTVPPTTTTDNIIVGAGGLNIETLSLPDNATVLYDPIKTPFYVWGTTEGAFSIGEGVKFKLTPNYANMTLGRVILFAYKAEYVTGLPENLNTLLDSTSIAPGATYTITSEDVPDDSPYRKQLVLTVGDYANDAKEIRLTCIGDSITQGTTPTIAGRTYDSGIAAQYRTAIAARLAANGYRPKMLGIWKCNRDDGARVQQNPDWIWHSGISADRIKTGGTRGGVRDNLHVYLDIAGKVDALTLLIGTNDLGAGDTAEDTYVAYTNLVFDIARQRPATKIIGSTILDRNGAESENHAKVVAFNALLAADYAANRLPANYVMLDLFAEVPLTSGADGNFCDDLLHPSWVGHSAIAEGFAAGITNALPFASYAGPIEDEATDAPQTALGVAGIAATTEGAGLAAYTNGMVHVFTIDAASSNNLLSGTSPYTATNTVTALNRPVTKAGYFMELVRKGTSRHRWVWVDFDATGKTLDEIDFPWTGANVDLVVDDLHVFSNDGSIHNVEANAFGVKGAIEGTHFNYSGTYDNENVPGDITAGIYGWNDTLGSSNGYGGFQAHRIFNDGEHWNEGEVLFAWNAWGSSNTAKNDQVGIGTFFYSQALGGSGNSADYTFTSDAANGAADTITAAGYQVVHLEIWATLDGEPRHGMWCGAGMDGDFDTAANWEDGVVPSAGDNIDFSALPAATTIAVTGASTNKTFGTATMGSSIVTFTGTVTFTGISDTSKIAVGADSTVTLDGNLEFSGSGNHYVANSVATGGRFVVTGDVIAKEDFTGYVFQCLSCGGGVVQARGLVNNATSNSDQWAFRLNAEPEGKVYWIIGDHGLSGSRYFWMNGSQEVEIQPLTSGFDISTKFGNWGSLTFNMTGADGSACTITIADAIVREGTIAISGTGKVLVDAVNTSSSSVAVTNTATLAINPGKVMTTGSITVSSNATLQVAQSGTVTLGGNLTLADGAILAFNYTDRNNAPVLDVTGKTVTLGDQSNVVVKVTASSGIRPPSKNNPYALTSGGGFTGANLTFDAGSAYWAKEISVNEDGNIELEVKSSGFYINLR